MTDSIRYYLVKNGTDTSSDAPFFVRVVPNGVANLNDIIGDILENINSTETRVKMALLEATKVMLAHVMRGETVDFGGIRFKAQIANAMEFEDSPFTPGVDLVEIIAQIDTELKDTFDGVVPVKLNAAEIANATKVSSEMDTATQTFFLVDGNKSFEILGNGISLDGEGEGVRLLRKNGELLAAATVDTVARGQRGTCHIADAIPAGNFVLEVTTFGLVGETKPRIFTKNVKVNAYAPPPPVVTGVQQGSLDPNVVWFSGGKLTISGENLAGTTQVRFEMDDEGETIVNDITDSIEEITDTALSTDEYGFENDSERQDLDWSGKNAKLIVVKGEESVEYAVTFKVAE